MNTSFRLALLFLYILTVECKLSSEEQQPPDKNVASKHDSSPLGPEVESCPTSSCPAEEHSIDEDLKGVPFETNEDSCPAEEHPKGTLFDLAETDEDPSFFDQIYGIASSVATTAKEKIYDNGARLIKNFSEAVRSVVSEELYAFLQNIANSLGDSLLTPGATLYYLGQTAMTITLVLLCLIISYLLLFRVSILFILGMNASVFLLHQLMGPKWIFDWIFYWAHKFSWVFMCMLQHYYISSVILVVLLVYSVVFPCVRRCTQRPFIQQINDLEMFVLDISRRVGEIEREQNERFGDIERRQNEMLEILRRLDARRRQ